MKLRKVSVGYWNSFYIPEEAVSTFMSVVSNSFDSDGDVLKIGTEESIELEDLIRAGRDHKVKRLQEDLERAKDHAEI